MAAIGSTLSAPVSRATRTPRVASSCQSSSSQRSWARRHASQSQRTSPCGRSLHVAERVERPPERRHAGRVALGEPRRQAVEEQVDRAWRLRCRRRSPSGLGSLADARLVAEATGEHRRRHRLEMGLASHRGVERLEAPGGIEQQRRSVAAARAGERDLRAQPLQPRALKLVERGKLGGRQQLERRVRCPGIELRLRGGQGPPAPLAPDRGSARPRAPGTPQPPPRPRGPAPGRPSAPARRPPPRRAPTAACARCHARRSGSVSGSVASASARCAARRSRKCSRPVDRRAHQRMPEPHPDPELDQPASSAGASERRLDPEPLGRAPRRASRRRPARPPPAAAVAGSRLGSAPDPLEKVLLEVARPTVCASGSPKPPASSAGVSPAAAPAAPAGCRGSRRRSVAHALVQPPRDGRRQQRARIVVGEPAERPAPAGRRSRACRSARGRRTPSPPIPPAAAARRSRGSAPRRRSSHCASSTRQTQRPLLGRLGQQAQHGQPDQEAIRDVAVAARPNATLSASRCGPGSASSSVEHRRAELMQPGERQLHLGLDARDPGDADTPRPARRRTRSSAVLPMPASPRRTSTALCPARTRCSWRSSASHSLRRPRSTARWSLIRRGVRCRLGNRPRRLGT